MSVTTGHGTRRGPRGAAPRREASRRDQLAALAELREVEHWRRLVAARLDLAVAAVAGVDEPAMHAAGPGAPPPPSGLRDLLGLTTADGQVPLLLRLRSAQRELDAYAVALRDRTRSTTAQLVTRLDDRRPAGAGADPLDTAVDGAAGPAAVLPLHAGARRRRRGAAPDDVA